MNFFSALVALKTIISRENKRSFRVWRQSLLPAVVNSILYFIIFGKIIGQRVGAMEGFSYIQYIAPGLIMMQIITASYSCAVSAFFSAKFQRQIQEIQVSPTPALIIILGFSISAIIRGLIVGLMVTLTALFFTHLHIHSFWIVAAVTICCSFLFALAGLVNAIYAKTYDDVAIVPIFILTPLTYLGGIFYSIHLLPPFWQTISLINPLIYFINTFRFGILGITSLSLTFTFIAIVFLMIVFFIYVYYLINSGRGLRE